VERTGGTVNVHELPTINADPLQMRQLLQNLIGNALKFHKPDVLPIITVSCQIVERNDGTNLCHITVADNGIGFDEKYLERIFHPFQRLHTNKEYEGTGIGLSLCRSIVQRHHGQLTAHSVKGEGATFVVTLPIYEKQEWENHE
jgi:signal transduction histidine kinase